ncbi:Hsp20/alpha crystallin family protein [Sinomonas gamaensis]|uniref:Hsp20/alpha crystallin family protein n=1 Tax=Sinomonas gamaensis TaxID=2565624 RepID=UPI0011086CA2|nr:Hsp20/alpha crystallin family protein [Sinomonas gamaensis]
MAEGWSRRGGWDMPVPPQFRRFGFPEQFRRFMEGDWDTGWLRIEEFREGETLVVRAEVPGIDPERDVDVSVRDGELNIRVDRQENSENANKDGYRSEFRYGSFARSVQLPRGARQEDIKASYRDGVLEIRVPAAPESGPGPTKINVSRD